MDNHIYSKYLTATKEEMSAEAIIRMTMLGLHPNVLKDFISEGKLNCSESLGMLYWLKDDAKQIVADFEKRTGFVVYHCITTTFTELGVLLSLLYVSSDMSVWDNDREFIEEGYTYAYVHNFDAPECSESGSIGFKKSFGGLMRTC